MISRNIPASVRIQLRKEVNFGCPIKGCGSPYLSYHHYNPQWHVQNHHNTKGMIALCLEHHKQADYGAFTNEQLDTLKSSPYLTSENIVNGAFNWKNQNTVFNVGSNIIMGAMKIYSHKE